MDILGFGAGRVDVVVDGLKGEDEKTVETILTEVLPQAV